MIARVFPRKTNLTPDDNLAFYGSPTMYISDGIKQVHISITFTYDLERGEKLAKEWESIAPVVVGGVAYGKPSGEFVPGMYVKKGAVITSRGCPNKCWFCSVWKREGGIRELPIVDGYNILDDNILSTSETHIKKVFEMLSRQKERPVFTGGLEAKILKSWHVELLVRSHPQRLYFAYDTEDDYEPLRSAASMLFDDGAFRPENHIVSCYCLIGFPGDTIVEASRRLLRVVDLGIMQMAMLYRGKTGIVDKEFSAFARCWARPILYSRLVKQ